MIGKIYSITNYFVIKEVNGQMVILANQNGQEIKSNLETVNKAMQSADDFKSEKIVTQTQFSEIIKENKNVAMSIYYQKTNTSKSKKAFNEELTTWKENVKEAFLKYGLSGLDAFAVNPVLKYIPGEMRLIKGYYPGGIGNNGFFPFVDVEDNYTLKSEAVNPRTIEYVIVNNIKYIKK